MNDNLYDDHFTGLQTLGAIDYGELDPLVLLKCSETLGYDRCEMDEYIFAIFAGDETVAFAGVKPLDGALNFF
jgi:hypothetical protein